MFKIGEFARLNWITVKTLRHYEKLQLLLPAKVDDFTGYRYYSASQIQTLNRILALRDLGFSLTEISELMKNKLSSEEMVGILKSRKGQIQAAINQELSRVDRVNNLIKLFEQEGNVMYDVSIKSIDSMKVASLRDKINHYGDQGHLWEEISDHVNKHKANILPGCFVSYYSHEQSEGIDAEVFEIIDQDIPSTDRIKVRDLPPVEMMACVVHRGSYETLKLAYSAIMKWIEDSNYKIIGPEREVYLEGPWSTENPDEYITEIQFPIESK